MKFSFTSLRFQRSLSNSLRSKVEQVSSHRSPVDIHSFLQKSSRRESSSASFQSSIASPSLSERDSKQASSHVIESKPSNYDAFISRHIGHTDTDIAEMLSIIGLSSLDDLIDKTIPAEIRYGSSKSHSSPKPLHPSMASLHSEHRALSALKSIADANIACHIKSLIGMGYNEAITPSVIRRCVLENPSWYTAYTPYQPEVSQGRLESLLNYQTMICELTGLEMANASLLDEATAAAEAMLMARRLDRKGRNTFYISPTVHPQTLNVVKTHAASLGIKIEVGGARGKDHEALDREDFDESVLCDVFGGLVQYPDTFGALKDYGPLLKVFRESEAISVVATDPLALVAVKPPSEFGADVAVGTSQRFGIPLGYGGPHAAFFATSATHARQLPGRIIGVSRSASGGRALRMALQTREQHIRKDKATSNICTAQALLANMAAMFGVYHGPKGLQRIAYEVHRLTKVLGSELQQRGYPILNAPYFFDTVAVEADNADGLLESLLCAGYSCRKLSNSSIGISINETTTDEDVQRVINVFETVADQGHVQQYEMGTIQGLGNFERREPFMQQKVFNTFHSEGLLTRYMTHLSRKDIGLDTSMIPLGSCTMKLNSAASLLPIVWPEFANVHPFAPKSTTVGYADLIAQLQTSLSAITGMDACSLQPNSGANGEYAGLVTIRSYQAHRGEANRNLCLIPMSAHGTNPASASLAGLKVIGLPMAQGDKSALDMARFREIVEEKGKDMSCLMITYPSTFGVFDSNIREICDLVHSCGAQVYMDGANMNAQLCLTSPGLIGADVCHLNLHKTFGIPHGGGGPGVGPICVKEHLASHLPSTQTDVPHPDGGNTVAGAPYGSAMVLPISWMFIAMLGLDGLRRCAEIAILNANYMAARLRAHFPVKFMDGGKYCAHEFIVDMSPFKKTGITEEDIAKRLMDFGFHAPTVSWPVPAAMMVEPTESEPKAELDRFCDAMIAIRKEIENVEKGVWPRDNNPLKKAPHTLKEVTADEWGRPYTRATAAYPADWILRRGKFWPSVNRVDNSFGDKNLVCGCGEVADFV